MKRQAGALLALFVAMMIATAPALATRVDHTPDAPVNLYNVPLSAGAAKLNVVAADTTNFESVTLTGRELLVAYNSGGSAYTVTITSSPDSLGRTGDITAYSIPAGEIHFFGPVPVTGFSTGGKLNFQASNVAVKFGVIRLPN